MKYIEKDEAYKIVLHHGSYAASAKIADLPSIDLVRCGECVNWERDWEPNKRGNDGMEWHYCPMIDSSSRSDWFCADGERSEE